ncbi:Transcription elongation factor B polypeptide 2 [Trichoplax sp. H2]|nr:Transcription elongation factor B polypeptide 2 [Trichoplax sp. H2]|eukprot:RDD46416.1 Transcription elongation factor B polypeptide 2 [Trichoplax sp. H2]
MDIFFMIRRQKLTLFTDCKETNTVLDLKKIIDGVTKVNPEDQRLFKGDEILDDSKLLSDCGFSTSTARAQEPAFLGLAFRGEDGEFEPLNIAPLTQPPDLPEVMKQRGEPSSDGNSDQSTSG